MGCQCSYVSTPITPTEMRTSAAVIDLQCLISSSRASFTVKTSRHGALSKAFASATRISNPPRATSGNSDSARQSIRRKRLTGDQISRMPSRRCERRGGPLFDAGWSSACGDRALIRLGSWAESSSARKVVSKDRSPRSSEDRPERTKVQ